MAGAPRLLSLWPTLRCGDAFTPTLRSAKAAARIQAFHSAPARRKPEQEAISQRYGSANEPPPHLGGGKGLGPSTKQFAEQQTKLPKIGEKLQKDGEHEVEVEAEAAADTTQKAERTEPTTIDARPMQMDPMLDAAELRPQTDGPGPPAQPEEKPLESVLDAIPHPLQSDTTPSSEHSQSPETAAPDHPSLSTDEHSPPIRSPHLDTPRHVHHFDTYGLVTRLSSAGWTTPQSITLMKAVRLCLADNMDLARDALVSKSNVENETYLFRAACAELKTEVTGRRKAEQEKQRTERTQLQHEVDILGQRLGQESGVMKDELKGMFDDRKMAVRNEQRGMESKVQQLNYKITVSLQADARSEVEGLRWVMTRRVILALGAVVVMILVTLRRYSTAVRDKEVEEKRRANMRSGGTQTDSGSGSRGFGDGERQREAMTVSRGEGDLLVKEGDLVSLG